MSFLRKQESSPIPLSNPPFCEGGKGDFNLLSPLAGEIKACPEPAEG